METAAAAEEAAVLASARSEAATILSAAEQGVAVARERMSQEVTAKAMSSRARIESEAHMHVEAREANARDAMVKNSFVRAAEILQSYRRSANYPSTLESVLREAEGQFPPDEQIIVRCDARDVDVIRRLLADRPYEGIVDASLVCWGGVQVTDHTGSIVCDNTLEQRLERARETLRWDVAAVFLQSYDAATQNDGAA